MSIPARKHPLYSAVLLFLLSVLVYGTVRELTAHVAHAAGPPAWMAAVPARAGAQDALTLHVANADTDLGPGEAEPMLVQHPSP